HRAVERVPGDESNAIGIGFDGEVPVVSHWSDPSLKSGGVSAWRDGGDWLTLPLVGRVANENERGGGSRACALHHTPTPALTRRPSPQGGRVKGGHTRSMIVAVPMPAPMQSVTSAVLRSRR